MSTQNFSANHFSFDIDVRCILIMLESINYDITDFMMHRKNAQSIKCCFQNQ